MKLCQWVLVAVACLAVSVAADDAVASSEAVGVAVSDGQPVDLMDAVEPDDTGEGEGVVSGGNFQPQAVEDELEEKHLEADPGAAVHDIISDEDDLPDTDTEQASIPATTIEVLSQDDDPSLVSAHEVFCELTCKLEDDPVCGNDGETYVNDCHLLASICKKPTLAKASHGPCPKPYSSLEFEVSMDEYGVYDALNTYSTPEPEPTPAPAPPAKCNPMCPRQYEPVCGSNGKTYANECLLEYGMCTTPTLFKFSDGKCPSSFEGITQNGAGAFGSVCVPEPCPSSSAPVCASDGQTYTNVCMFANARCVQPRLFVVHEGACGADTVISCAIMTCPTFTECKEEDGTGVPYCADVCSPDRCGEHETCELIDAECYTAPCSPVATCVPMTVV